MKLLILLLLTLPAFSQQYTYTKTVFDFMGADSLTRTWSRDLRQTVTITIDTVKKQVIIPNCQVFSNNTTRRNMLTDQVTTIADTTLTISGTTTLTYTAPINVSSDGYARGIYFNNKMAAVIFPDYFFIVYPLWGKYYRVIEFTNK